MKVISRKNIIFVSLLILVYWCLTSTTINAKNNWWGDPSGPYHPTLNPNGLGDRVSDRVDFIPWLGYDPTVPPERIRPDEAVGLAKEVIGKDYHFEWGNSLTKGYYQDSISKKFIFLRPEDVEYLDCSGLNFWSFNRAYYGERELINTEFEDRPLYYEGSNMQYLGNTDREIELTKEDLRPGDLLFFDTWNRITETYGQDNIVDHVAMYIGLYEGEQYAVEHAHLGNDNTNNAGKISVTTVDGLINYYKAKFGENAFKDFGRVIDRKLAKKIIGHSPIDLIVTAPDGEVIYENIGAREAISEPGDIGDSLTMGYMVYDIDGDGEPDDIVVSPERKLGDYLITVIAEPDASPTDTYSLEMESLINGEIITTVLAEDVPISEIPRTPYIVESTETEIIPIISAFIDFDPDTLNLKSKGKYVTVYIELPRSYNINEINLESIRLNDQIPIESKPAQVGDYDRNNVSDLMIKFNRSAVQDILEISEEVKVTVTGEMLDGSPFKGSDTIRVISQGKKTAVLTAAFFGCLGILGFITYKRKPDFLRKVIKITKIVSNFKRKI